MVKNGVRALLIMVSAFMLHRISFAAEVLDVPNEELAKESVLPIFDKVVGVKNRNIKTTGRIDAGIFYGYAMTEPIANVNKFGASAYYNYDEDNAVGILISRNMSGLSDYAKQIEQKPTPQIDLGRAPMPLTTFLVDYNNKAFYGKLSISKSAVINTLLLGSAGLGAVQYENKTYPAVAFGLGQKFFFSRNLALRFDMRMYVHQAPIPFLAGKMSGSSIPSYSEFSERVIFTTNLDVGFSYLF